jgi:DNA-directed RNA polymerase specialized sigma subunit
MEVIKMTTQKTLKYGYNVIHVSNEVYATANRENERIRKKRQRLNADGLSYTVRSLDVMYQETEYEVIAEDNTAETGITNVLTEQLWIAITKALDEKDAFIITEYYRNNQTESQIAKILGISQQAVGARKRKAEKRLKIVLKSFKNMF